MLSLWLAHDDQDENGVLSIDELYRFILYYTKDTDDDGVDTGDADGGAEQDEEEEEAELAEEEDAAETAETAETAEVVGAAGSSSIAIIASLKEEQAVAAKEMHAADQQEAQAEIEAKLLLLEQSSVDRLGEYCTFACLLDGSGVGGRTRARQMPSCPSPLPRNGSGGGGTYCYLVS